MKRILFLLILLTITLLAACSPEPEVLVEEVTRVVTEIVFAEVTRMVELEVTREVPVTQEVEVTLEIEITRIVEVIVTPTHTPTAQTVRTSDCHEWTIEHLVINGKKGAKGGDDG